MGAPHIAANNAARATIAFVVFECPFEDVDCLFTAVRVEMTKSVSGIPLDHRDVDAVIETQDFAPA